MVLPQRSQPSPPPKAANTDEEDFSQNFLPALIQVFKSVVKSSLASGVAGVETTQCLGRL